MQRKVIRRLPSKDDSDLKKVANTENEKGVQDDLHFKVHSNRADRLKIQFVQVYVGSREFNVKGQVLNAIIAIYLQASDRLYEVLFVSKDDMTEIARFYVFEDELKAQMSRRYQILQKKNAQRSVLVMIDDISAVDSQDIAYFSSVILKSLSLNKDESSFLLHDDITHQFYEIWNTIPGNVKSSEATIVDCESLIQIIELKLLRSEICEATETEAQQVNELLNAVDTLSNNLAVDEEEIPLYKQADTMNPNRNRRRLLWQAAYTAIAATENKKIRAKWTEQLDRARAVREREKMMQIAVTGNFRKFAVGSVTGGLLELHQLRRKSSK